jgi:hypothetical protein
MNFPRIRSHDRGASSPSITLGRTRRFSRRDWQTTLALVISLGVGLAQAQDSLRSSAASSLEATPASPTLPGAGAPGFTNWTAGFTLGAGRGLNAMGSTQAHDLAIAAFRVGRLLDSERPLIRHLELAGELWTGAQFHPDTAYVAGLTPMLRYRLLPGSRWTPFLDAGAGVTATDIGHPDLSTTFEFNLQAGGGLQWRWRRNAALLFQARYMHLSNASMDTPNLGVNSLLFSAGATWFF